MKISVIYTGEPRTFESCVESHKSFLEGFDVSSFHSTWSKDYSKTNIDLMHLAPNTQQINTCEYTVPDRPDLWRFEKLVLTHKKNHPIFMFGRIQYMTYKGFEPIYNRMQDFDLVIKLRYDFTYNGKLMDYLESQDYKGKIYITKKMGGKSHPRNVWDGFAFGDPYIMSWYFDCHRFVPFSLFHSEIARWKFQPEYVLGYYLEHLGIPIVNSEMQPVHTFPDNAEEHRRRRTIQYYKDLLDFHPEFWGQIENDCPSTSDDLIRNTLRKEGYSI